MLAAISRGKAGRLDLPGPTGPASWREVFRKSEDLLTAVVFGRLRFLSDAGVSRVMANLVGEEHAPTLGSLEQVEFWPNLRGLEERRHVQPDLILTFAQAVIVVEVKPPFGGVQTVAQWEDQIRAFVAECREGGRDEPQALHLLALGRNHAATEQQLVDALGDRISMRGRLHCREWEPFVLATSAWQEQGPPTDRAVFSDWLEAFRLFGMEPRVTRDWSELIGLGDSSGFSEATRLLASRLDAVPGRAPQHLRHQPWRPVLDLTNRHPLELAAWK